jgi:hypothetical protein
MLFLLLEEPSSCTGCQLCTFMALMSICCLPVCAVHMQWQGRFCSSICDSVAVSPWLVESRAGHPIIMPPLYIVHLTAPLSLVLRVYLTDLPAAGVGSTAPMQFIHRPPPLCLGSCVLLHAWEVAWPLQGLPWEAGIAGYCWDMVGCWVCYLVWLA